MRYEAAIGAYSEAAAIAPDRALPHAAIGGILVKMGRPAEALESYGRALAIAPRDEQALRGRAELLAAAGRRVEAAELLDRRAGGARRKRAPGGCQRRGAAGLDLAESRERRRQVESYAERLRASAGDEAAARALAHVLRVLEPPVAPQPPGPDVDLAPERRSPPRSSRSSSRLAVRAEAGAEPFEAPSKERGNGFGERAPGNRTLVALRSARKASKQQRPQEEAIDALRPRSSRRGRPGRRRRGHRPRRPARRSGRPPPSRPLLRRDRCLLHRPGGRPRRRRPPRVADRALPRARLARMAVDKLLLLGRLADLAEDSGTRERLCAIATDQLRRSSSAELCA